MREIKFRGKFKKDGEWEYGGIRFGDMGQAYILPHGASHRVELVNRDSVGQFTGLHDKNGKEIYEGDVVKNRYGVCWEVCWFEPKYQWRFRRGQNTFTLTDKQFWSCSQNKRTKVSAEIIGNIYENPDLLTKD